MIAPSGRDPHLPRRATLHTGSPESARESAEHESPDPPSALLPDVPALLRWAAAELLPRHGKDSIGLDEVRPVSPVPERGRHLFRLLAGQDGRRGNLPQGGPFA